MNTKKGIAPIIIALILTVVLGGSYIIVTQNAKRIAQNTTVQEKNTTIDTTKDWKTYRNEKYGFEFKSPARKVELYQSSNADYLSRDREFYGLYGVSNQDYAARVDVYPGTSIATVLRDNRFVNTLKVSGTLTINNITWTKVGTYDYLSVHNGNTYHVLGEANLTSPVLESFKFIDEDKTAEWKIYRNDKYGFEMKIPSDAIIKLYDNDLVNKLVYFKYNKNNFFEVRLTDNKQWRSLNDYFKLTDSISSRSETKLANHEAMILYRPDYGEGGDHFPRSVIVATDYGGYFYIITFFGNEKLSAIEENILSTFKFTK